MAPTLTLELCGFSDEQEKAIQQLATRFGYAARKHEGSRFTRYAGPGILASQALQDPRNEYALLQGDEFRNGTIIFVDAGSLLLLPPNIQCYAVVTSGSCDDIFSSICPRQGESVDCVRHDWPLFIRQLANAMDGRDYAYELNSRWQTLIERHSHMLQCRICSRLTKPQMRAKLAPVVKDLCTLHPW